MGLKYPLKKFDSQWPFPMGIWKASVVDDVLISPIMAYTFTIGLIMRKRP